MEGNQLTAEAEKREKAEAEEQRVAGIRNAISQLQALPSECIGCPSYELSWVIEHAEAFEVTIDNFAQFTGEAEVAKTFTVKKLGEMLSAQIAHEAELKRLAVERAELARQRAEQEEKDRIAGAARAAEEERQQKRSA
jgi:hypothetical protein